MNDVFKIPESLYGKYHGCGHALAAVTGGQIVDFEYLEALLPDLDIEDEEQVRSALGDPTIGPTVRYLSGLGEVFVGMCSCYEFVVI